MTNEERRAEISGKFIQMGKSLLNEGNDNKDGTLMQSGTVLLLLATVIVDEDDMLIFAEMCSMFSAKKILMDMEGMNQDKIISEILKKRAVMPKTRKRKPKDNNPNEIN